MEPRYLLRLEGLAGFVVAAVAFHLGGGSWPLFLVLFLAPDLSMAGYLVGSRVGAATYDVVHVAALPGAMLVVAWSLGWPLGVDLALVWLAHLGADRAVGFGLKYPGAAFSETHLQRV